MITSRPADRAAPLSLAAEIGESMSDERNLWNPEGMGSNWKERCPLRGPERYLWKIFRAFPDVNWTDRKAVENRPPLHIYYQDGWEAISHLQDILFAASYCVGGGNWQFSHHICAHAECSLNSEALVNAVRTEAKDESGDSIFLWLDDAPRFLCFPHLMELLTGEKYVPPSGPMVFLTMELERRG